ncbi:MAG: DUF4352 domain-containing protein [Chloroflexi bacterium]|nr:DUF4352 domain-containing protein [Chloroflexota bacterium]
MILVCLSVACTRQPTVEHHYALGETAEVDGWQITVHSFSILPPDPWHQPQGGYVFCAVELTLQNASGQIRYVMPEKQMTLLDGDGHAYALDSSASVMAARLHNWFAPQGGFEPDQKAYGAAAYQVPANAQNLRWVFRGGLLPWSSSAVFVLGDLPGQ